VDEMATYRPCGMLTSGLRVLNAIGSAVPVRLMKRDLLSVIERPLFLMDENRVEMLARQHGIRQKRDDGGVKINGVGLIRFTSNYQSWDVDL
jgi:ParB family chromosome partitioning protein